MFWNILRPRYWILDRKVRAMKPMGVIFLLLALGFAGQFLYDHFILRLLTILGSGQAISTVASAIPVGLTFFLLFAMLGVGDMMTQLYLVSDLDLLMVAPIPFRTLYLVKMMHCSRATWVPALMFTAFLTLFGLAQNVPVVYFGLTIILLLATIILTTVTVMILVILLARFIPAQMVRTWMPLILILLTFALVLSFPLITNSLVQENSISFLVGALLNPKELGLIVAGFSGMAVILGLLGYLIFEVSFHEGWDRFQVAPAGRSHRNTTASRRKDLSWFLKWLPTPLRHFLVKEWLEMRRNPRGPITMIQPLVIILMLLLPFLNNASMIAYFSPFIFWFLAITLVMLLGIIPLSTIIMTVIEEGRKLALIRSAPIKMSEMLKGKFWAAWLPMVLSWAIILSVVGRLLHYSMGQTGFLVLLMGYGLTGVSLISISIGGLKADFSIEELNQRVSPQISLLIMGLNTIFMLLTFMVFSWGLVRLVPDSQAVDMIRSFSDSAIVGWLFSSSIWNPVFLVAAQAGFMLGIWYLWKAAVHRLEGWEQGQ